MAEKYPIENGIADGHVYMDEKLVEGNFSLEAYTRHSFFNDTTEMLAARNIKVVKNIAHDSGQAEKRKKRELRFDLFPEGGNLVPGYLPVWLLRNGRQRLSGRCGRNVVYR